VKITGKYSTSNSRVKELGMTKYVKAGDGVYEKATGKAFILGVMRGEKLFQRRLLRRRDKNTEP